ncbi:MAG TPA: type II toxin-antitoxin system RelE/ParE family toxin [Bacteroidales bacterium]|nr:type II toxin-antitoxin system RelE/ParE family toxin [Bacteroidales bacterium]
MIITFADNNLRKYANDNRLAVRKLGPKRAELFHRRLEDIYDTENFAGLEHLPGRYHQLKENKKGQWACDLDHPYRLIFEPAVKPVPIDKDGKIILNEIKAAEIIKIEDYH